VSFFGMPVAASRAVAALRPAHGAADLPRLVHPARGGRYRLTWARRSPPPEGDRDERERGAHPDVRLGDQSQVRAHPTLALDVPPLEYADDDATGFPSYSKFLPEPRAAAEVPAVTRHFGTC